MAAAAICLPREDELWSGSRETLEQRMGYFLGNEFLSDMTFLVGAEKRRIPGHKLILSSCSWDFYNALHLLRIDNDELSIQDVPYESFLDFLRYCYTGILDLKPENAINIMKLAYRFEMKPLIKKSEAEIWKMIRGDSCLKLFVQCDFLPKESPLKIRILSEIAANFLKITEDQSMMETFMNLSLKAVDDIADVKFLPCEEVKMFEALMKWSTGACEKSGINPTHENLRETLGHVFNKIRFPAMRSQDFVKVMAKYPKILTVNEVIDIAKKMAGPPEDNVAVGCDFSNISRVTDEYGTIASLLELGTNEFVPLISFDGLTKTSYTTTSCDLSVGFKVRSEKKLIGFGWIASKEKDYKDLVPMCNFRMKCIRDNCCYMKNIPDPVKTGSKNIFYGDPCSCRRAAKNESFRNVQERELTFLQRFKGYCVYSTFFDGEKHLTTNQSYALICRLEKNYKVLELYIYEEPHMFSSKMADLEGLEVNFTSESPSILFLYFAK